MASRQQSDRIATYGRGGAGNILKDDPAAYVKPEDLVTPTLKSEKYTTGRGGTGNMARNDPANPELARLAQDVDAPLRTETPPQHGGRGGAGNFRGAEGQRKSVEAKRNSVEAKRSSSEARREEGPSKGLLGKVLNKLKK